MPDTRHYHHVLIVMDRGSSVRGYGQRMLDGIIDFARRQSDWRFQFQPDYGGEADLLDRVGHWDGMVGMPTPELRQRIVDDGRPGVLGVRIDNCPLPQVYPDDPAVGRMAYDYFRGLGFERLAFLGHGEAPFSADRRDAFLAAAEAEGVEAQAFAWQLGAEAVGRWLASLEPPTALFCVNVRLARDVARICEQRNLRVPQDLAILGCDDDPHMCELTWPPLSTIDHGAYEVGFRGAEMLDTLMRGGTLDQRQVVVPPVRVIERQSTNTLAIPDENVAEALHYIRAYGCDGIEVEDVLQRVPASRRTLERAFRKHVKLGIRQEITRVRLRRACELLSQTDLPTPDVAARSGFSSASKLSAVFRRELNLTPTAYRRSHRH